MGRRDIELVLSQDIGNSFYKTIKIKISKPLIWRSTRGFTPTIKRAKRIETGT